MPRHQATPIRRGPGYLWAKAGSCDCYGLDRLAPGLASWVPIRFDVSGRACLSNITWRRL
jgi:hypothetical protein